MALDQSALLELTEVLRTADPSELMRTLTLTLLQSLVDAEATEKIGAGRHERSEARTTQRNGTRPKTVATTIGDLTVKIPKLRQGSFFPSLLEPRRRIDVALHAVVMEAYVHGVSTRKVDDLVAALGVDSGLSKSEVSRICSDLDEQTQVWRDRPLDAAGGYPYVFLDATYVHGRTGGDSHGKGGRVTSRAVVIATAVTLDGRREVLGCSVGDSEDETFWTEFLRRLRERGLAGVQLVVSDSHAGLKKAIARCLSGAAWQRCRVHAMRNLLAHAPKGQEQWAATAIRTIFAQPDACRVREQVETVAGTLQVSMPKVAELLRDARTDLTAFAGFPAEHWRKIWSTNPIERLNREVKRRTDVVGIFPNDEAVLRLVTAILIEADEEWQTSDRRYLSEASMSALLTSPAPAGPPPPALPTANNQENTDTPTQKLDNKALDVA